VSWIVLYRCVQGSPQLLIDPGQVDFVRSSIRRATVSVVVFPLAAALAFVSPVAALVDFVALPLFFIGAVFVAVQRAAT